METAERIYEITLPQHKRKLLNGLKIQSKIPEIPQQNMETAERIYANTFPQHKTSDGK